MADKVETVRLVKMLVETVRELEPSPTRFKGLLCCQRLLHMNGDHSMCVDLTCDVVSNEEQANG